LLASSRSSRSLPLRYSSFVGLKQRSFCVKPSPLTLARTTLTASGVRSSHSRTVSEAARMVMSPTPQALGPRSRSRRARRTLSKQSPPRRTCSETTTCMPASLLLGTVHLRYHHRMATRRTPFSTRPTSSPHRRQFTMRRLWHRPRRTPAVTCCISLRAMLRVP